MQGLIKDFDDRKSKSRSAVDSTGHASHIVGGGSAVHLGRISGGSDVSGALCSSPEDDRVMISHSAGSLKGDPSHVSNEMFADPLRCPSRWSSDGNTDPRSHDFSGAPQPAHDCSSPPPEGLEYRLMPQLSTFVKILLESPGDLLSEEASCQLCDLLPEEHRAEVSRHIAELRRRHKRMQKGKDATNRVQGKFHELAELGPSSKRGYSPEAPPFEGEQESEPGPLSPSAMSSSSSHVAEDDVRDPLRTK